MANAMRAQVNQRLYFCRLHLQWLEQQLAELDLPRRVVERSLGESLYYHLGLAYRAYLAEIAANCAIPVVQFDNASALIEALASAGRESADARHWLSLESEASWLSELVAFNRSVLDANAAPTVNSVGDIAVLHSQVGAPSIHHGRSCLTALEQLIETQRAGQEEW